MKTLSIRNPWSYLIASGIKDVENRTRRTKYRGKVLIHSPAKWDDNHRNMSHLFTYEQWDSLSKIEQTKMAYGTLPCSAIIGLVEIVDCVEDADSIWALEGHWHWVLENAVLFDKPILGVKGKLSFWEYDLDNQ